MLMFLSWLSCSPPLVRAFREDSMEDRSRGRHFSELHHLGRRGDGPQIHRVVRLHPTW